MAAASAETETSTQESTKPAPRDKPECEDPKRWNVVLLDDDEHTYEYVIRMMRAIFSHPVEKGFRIAQAVDSQGRAICLTTHKEHAELKRDQIHAFGKDPLMSGCKGSMSALIEPADHGDEDDETGGDADDAGRRADGA